MRLFQTKKSRRIWLLSGLGLALLLVLCCIVYLNDYYPGDTTAISAFSAAVPISVESLEGSTVYTSAAPEAGFIFYPGGKVEHTAYEPLMKACAERGLLCVLVEMPFRLAVFDINAASGIPEQYPQIDSWYIGGHSLGGSMAAQHLTKHTDQFDGLVLLGSYSTADLSQLELNVLSVYGSEDQVLNRDSYEEYWSNLPEETHELIIDGGCHAYFGMYGSQDGDGVPSISQTDQIIQTADAISNFIL